MVCSTAKCGLVSGKCVFGQSCFLQRGVNFSMHWSTVLPLVCAFLGTAQSVGLALWQIFTGTLCSNFQMSFVLHFKTFICCRSLWSCDLEWSLRCFVISASTSKVSSFQIFRFKSSLSSSPYYHHVIMLRMMRYSFTLVACPFISSSVSQLLCCC